MLVSDETVSTQIIKHTSYFLLFKENFDLGV